MRNQTHDEELDTRPLDRRALLRTGVALVAGAAAAQTAGAGNADATAGDPMLVGSANSADAVPTSLTSAATTAATLSIANTGSRAPLNLVQKAFPASTAGLTSGSLANFDGDLYYTTGTSSGPFTGFVYTALTANQIVPIKPHRIVDTRTAAGRAHIANAAGNLDSLGRLRAGHTIVIRLNSLEVAADAAFCTLSVVAPLASGSVTLWASATRPGTSSMYYRAGGITSNFAVTGTSSADTVDLYSSATTHVLLDISAFAVGNPGQINPAVFSAAASSTASQRLAAHTRAGTLPDWYTAQ